MKKSRPRRTRRRDNPTLQRTGRANETVLVIPTRLGAQPAVECWSVMRQKFLTLVAVISLAMFVAVGTLWVRSYFAYDYLVRNRQVGWHFWSVWGSVGIHVIWWGDQLEKMDEGFKYYQPFPAGPPSPSGPDAAGVTQHWRGLGFDVERAVPAGPTTGGAWSGARQIKVIVPHWFLMLPTLPLPAIWLVSSRRNRRAQRGLCPTCGYDLRATRERCPECGTITDAVTPPPHNPPMHRTGPVV
jgi:hypothetical protein